MIETIPGKGTYVVRERKVHVFDNQVEGLRQRFQQLLVDGEALGLSPSFFIGLLNQETPETFNLPFKIVFVGNSNRINRSYLDTIQKTLSFNVEAESYTFHEFDELQDEVLDQYALYLTIPHCIPRLRQRLPEKIQIYAPYLLPSENTRMRLASLSAESRVLLISRFGNFIPAMLEGVRNFAPHLGEIKVITLDDDGLQKALAAWSVVIYSTGCHSYLQQFPSSEVMFEYRHTPDPRYLREILLPALHQYTQNYLRQKG